MHLSALAIVWVKLWCMVILKVYSGSTLLARRATSLVRFISMVLFVKKSTEEDESIGSVEFQNSRVMDWSQVVTFKGTIVEHNTYHTQL